MFINSCLQRTVQGPLTNILQTLNKHYINETFNLLNRLFFWSVISIIVHVLLIC